MQNPAVIKYLQIFAECLALFYFLGSFGEQINGLRERGGEKSASSGMGN